MVSTADNRTQTIFLHIREPHITTSRPNYDQTYFNQEKQTQPNYNVGQLVSANKIKSFSLLLKGPSLLI